MSLTAAVIRELIAAGLDGDDLIAAAERIEAADRPRTVAERVRAHRERQKAAIPADVTSNVTSLHADEQRRVPPTPPSQENQEDPAKENPPKGGKKKGAPAQRGERLPADFAPDFGVAEALGLPRPAAEREAERFRDYWLGVAGQRGRKLDWPATWRNWCRKAADDQAARPSTGPPLGRPKRETFADLLRSTEAFIQANDRPPDDDTPPRLALAH